jgi:hypothetical protein
VLIEEANVPNPVMLPPGRAILCTALDRVTAALNDEPVTWGNVRRRDASSFSQWQ